MFLCLNLVVFSTVPLTLRCTRNAVDAAMLALLLRRRRSAGAVAEAHAVAGGEVSLHWLYEFLFPLHFYFRLSR